MPNSLTLKQCHFDGQSSILFPKYIFEFSQGLYNPDRILFFYCISPSPHLHIANSGLPSSLSTFWLDSGGLAPQAARHQLARARPRATPTNPHVKYKCVPILILRLSFSPLNSVQIQKKASRIWFTGLEKICSKYLENKRLHCFEKWHCLSDSEFVIFRSVFVNFSSLSTSRSLNRPDTSDTRRTFLHLTLSDF